MYGVGILQANGGREAKGKVNMADVFSREELQRRIDGLREAVLGAGLDGALVLQRADLIYYTGAVFQGALAVPAEGDPVLFTWRGQGRIGESCPVEPRPVKGFGKLHEGLLEAGIGAWKRVGLEEDTVPISMYKRLQAKVWPEAMFQDISPAIRAQRSVKSEAELVYTRRSAKALVAGFQALKKILREGIPEYEAQALMDVVMRREGDQAGGRTRGFNAEARGVIAYGASAAEHAAFDGPIGQPGRNPLAPMGAGTAQVGRGLPIIADHTCGVMGYMSDMTRTYAVGELEGRFTEAHDFCVQLHKEVLRKMVPGALPSELYLWALEEAERAGYGDVFMNQGPNRVRFLGHGVGIELDEWPVLAKPFTAPLQENMVVAVEPKIIYGDGGVGVEDTVVVTPGGAEVLTEMEYEIIPVG